MNSHEINGSSSIQAVEPGLYRHYSGKEYRVLFLGRHSETLEELVVYQALYRDSGVGLGPYWVRPKAIFLEEVETHIGMVARFTRIFGSGIFESGIFESGAK
jgi:hypothetical protein